MIAINKIIEDKVKSRMCRTLPSPLQSYLKAVVKIPKPHKRNDEASVESLPQIKTREAIEDHPEADQPDFLFYKEGKETPDVKRRHIEYKMKIIKSLLTEYKQMSGKCKIKMRFVRDYLEKNLLILQALYARCKEEEAYRSHSSDQKEKKHTTHPKGMKSNGSDSQRSIDKELKKIGWENRKNKLLTDSDIDKIVRQSMRKGKRETYLDSNKRNGGSAQYNALLKAVEKLRKKQEKEQKLGRLFGEKRSVINEKYETIKSTNKEAQDFKQLNFEEPVVFSMDN